MNKVYVEQWEILYGTADNSAEGSIRQLDRSSTHQTETEPKSDNLYISKDEYKS